MVDKITKLHGRFKRLFDRRARPRKFMEGDFLFLWDKRNEPKGMHSKFMSFWKGPFRIIQVNQNNYFKLTYPTGETQPCSYNG